MAKLRVCLGVVLCCSVLSGTASGDPILSPVPANAYITVNGWDWAWAAPCAPVAPSCGAIDLTYQGQFGWRLPTPDEFITAGITADSFVVPGGNVDFFTGNNFDELSSASLGDLADLVPRPLGDLAIAVPYFSTQHFHADWADGRRGVWAVIHRTEPLAESLVVRPAVPEPASLCLLGLGLAGLGVRRWRQRKV